MLLVKEEGNGKISNLFFRVFGSRDEVDGFKMSEIDVPSENVYVQELFASVRVHVQRH